MGKTEAGVTGGAEARNDRPERDAVSLIELQARSWLSISRRR